MVRRVRRNEEGFKRIPLSGYQYYQQVNKAQFNSEMDELVSKGEEKPKYVAYVASKWKGVDVILRKLRMECKGKESVSK